jgi:hypothetical protein
MMTKKKNRMSLHVSLMTAMLFLVASISYGQTSKLPTAPTPPPAVGSLLGQVKFATNCPVFSLDVGSGVGVGITFDGQNLWYSCLNSKNSIVATNHNDLFKADPKTGAVLASYDIAGGLGAIAYDGKRNVIWAGEGDGYNDPSQWGVDLTAKVLEIQLDNKLNVLPTTCATKPCPLYTVAFADVQAYQDFSLLGYSDNKVDGLAIDATTDTLYVHYAFATDIFKYSVATGPSFGTFLAPFLPEVPGIPAGTPVFLDPAYAGAPCVVGGLAIGGTALIEGSDYCDHVWAVDKTTQLPIFDFDFSATVRNLVFSNPGFDQKASTCDTSTFKSGDAIWVKEPYDNQTAFAFMIPAGSCGEGGLPATVNHKKK